MYEYRKIKKIKKIKKKIFVNILVTIGRKFLNNIIHATWIAN
jgi:uncharacterized membrane protein YqaE (UPF0057 family)